MARSLDDIDYRLIELLETDGRMSNSALGRHVGLTEGAVRRRVDILISSGALRIVGMAKADIYGLALHSILCLQVALAEAPHVVQQLSEFPEFRFVYETSGRFNVVAVGFFLDQEAFRQFLAQRLSAFTGIAHMETLTILSTTKTHYGLSDSAVHLAREGDLPEAPK